MAKLTMILSLITLAGTILWGSDFTWISKVSGYDGRITKNSNDISEQHDILERMDYNIQIIARKVGLVPLKKDSGE